MSPADAPPSGYAVRVPPVYEMRYADRGPCDTYADRVHRCYELAANAQLEWAMQGWDVLLVHGSIGPYRNPHGWLEFRLAIGNVSRRYVWDGVLDRILEHREYRDRWRARAWSKYSPPDAAALVVSTEAFGPWGKDNARYEVEYARLVRDGIGVGVQTNPDA